MYEYLKEFDRFGQFEAVQENWIRGFKSEHQEQETPNNIWVDYYLNKKLLKP